MWVVSSLRYSATSTAVAPRRRQRVAQQMGVGAAPGIGLDQPNRVVHPRAVAGCESATEATSVTAPRQSGAICPDSRPGVTTAGRRGHQSQQRRLGPAAEPQRRERRRADARRDVQRHVGAPPRRALGPRPVEVAVGDDGAVERQAELAAVGVAGHHQLIAVGRRTGRAPGFRRVRQAQPSGSRRDWPARRWSRTGRASMCGSSTPAAAMRSPATSSSRRVCVMSSQPRSVNAARRSCHGSGCRAPGARVGQVVGRVLQPRPEVVVAAEHENAGHRKQVAQRLHDGGHRLRVRQVVAGVDHQIRLPAGELAQPGLFAPLVGPHVDIADVQHPQRRRTRASAPASSPRAPRTRCAR